MAGLRVAITSLTRETDHENNHVPSSPPRVRPLLFLLRTSVQIIAVVGGRLLFIVVDIILDRLRRHALDGRVVELGDVRVLQRGLQTFDHPD